MMMDNGNLTKEQIEEDIRQIKEAHAEDEEYPNEVDAPVDIPARKRFAKYRGLKLFRTSSWDPKESLPQEYARRLQGLSSTYERNDLKKTCISSLASVFPEDCSTYERRLPQDTYHVYVSGATEFQLVKVELLKDPCSLNLKKDAGDSHVHFLSHSEFYCLSFNNGLLDY